MSLRVQPDPESKVHPWKRRHSESLRQKNTCAEISSVSTKKRSKHYQSVLSGNLMLYDANDWTEKQFDSTIMTIHLPTVHIWFILWWSNSTFLYFIRLPTHQTCIFAIFSSSWSWKCGCMKTRFEWWENFLQNMTFIGTSFPKRPPWNAPKNGGTTG